MKINPCFAIVPLGVGMLAGAVFGGLLAYRVGYESRKIIPSVYSQEREKLGQTIGGILGTLGTVWGGMYGLAVGSAFAAGTAPLLFALKNTLTAQ